MYSVDLVLDRNLFCGILKESNVKSSLEIGKFMSILTLPHSMVDVVQDALAGRQCHLQATLFFVIRCQHSTLVTSR